MVRNWSPHGKISVIGALTISPKTGRLGICTLLSADNQNICSDQTLDFLKLLRRSIKGSILICWDKGRVHQSREVNAYLDAHPEIKIEEFPSYAPELNPIEFLWSAIKKMHLANYCASNLTVLRLKIENELIRIKMRKDLIASFIQHALPSAKLLR